MKKNKYLFFVLLAVFLALAFYDHFRKAKTEEIGDASPWQVYQYDNYHFSFESPFPLLKNKKMFVDVLKLNKKLFLYADAPDQSFHLVVESQEYRGPVPSDHLDQFQKKVVGLFQSNPGIQNFRSEARPVTLSDQPGLEVAGSYTLQGDFYQFDGIEVAKGNWSWNLETVFQDQSRLADQAQQIFQSFKIQD